MTERADGVDERIMDAALDRLLQFGIRRASLEDIARMAGLSRITIHRRFAGKDNLIEAVLARETRRMLAEVTAIAATADSVDAQIEDTMLYVLLQTRIHRLVTQLLRVAPDEALRFSTVQGERLVSIGIEYIVGMLTHARSAGLIAAYDPHPVAELVARLAHSLLLTPGGGSVDFTDDERARAFVRTTIVPLIKHGITRPDEELTHDHVRDRPGTAPRPAP
ncbi:putative TetR-family transcriptional regulator [Nocardia sputorum]|uniref:TetR/AcrR family transcriptional regulator n=1 Tax=Nocardia sputorum TaxID=2984338 RepID=UPI00248F7349|nr:TetR/AcrR family transcriptional regulator [Nocardia sputorum]BDT91871.1 putative TetR-family transcriptional regulator [Nocardia sputorum]